MANHWWSQEIEDGQCWFLVSILMNAFRRSQRLLQNIGASCRWCEVFIHCQKEENFVIKIISCHGVLTGVDDHDTFLDVANTDGSRSLIKVKYPEPIWCHNQAKHWVDYSNSQWHDPIALSDVWRTNQWPNLQLTFLLEVAKANVGNARACAQKVKTEPQLEISRILAKRILLNNLDDGGNSVVQVEQPKTQSTVDNVANDHTLEIDNRGIWGLLKNC